MSAKIATLGLPEIKIFWSKGYDVIISVHDVTNKTLHVTQVLLKILSGGQSLVTPASLWQKYYNLNFTRIWPENPLFLKGGLGQVQ